MSIKSKRYMMGGLLGAGIAGGAWWQYFEPKSKACHSGSWLPNMLQPVSCGPTDLMTGAAKWTAIGLGVIAAGALVVSIITVDKGAAPSPVGGLGRARRGFRNLRQASGRRSVLTGRRAT